MTFKNCTENFPIYDTLVGLYSTDQSFSVPRGKNLDDIEKWRDNPFWEDWSCFSFVVFRPLIKKFECWTFCFYRVKGYINETDDTDEFYPAIYSEDFNWEKIDPFDPDLDNEVITPDDELAMQMGWPLNEYKKDPWRREQVAFLFNPEAYESGYIFTSPKALKKFVNERKELL